MDGGPEWGMTAPQARWKISRKAAPLLLRRPCIPFIGWTRPLPVAILSWASPAPFRRPPSPVSLQQRLKRWEDPLDNQPIALSCRMNAVGLIERGGACYTIEEKRNPR